MESGVVQDPWLPCIAAFFLSSSPPAVPFWVQPSHPGLLCFWGFAVAAWGKISGLEDGVWCWINPISARNDFGLWEARRDGDLDGV